MGSEQITYVGAYLKIEAEKIPASSPFICPEHTNKEFWEPGFCQKCGKALVRDSLRLKTASIWDLLPDNNDEFLQVDYVDVEGKSCLTLLSNEKHISPDHIDRYELDDTEVTKNIIDTCLRNFKNNHKESIKKLRVTTTRLAIKFGVVQYYL